MDFQNQRLRAGKVDSVNTIVWNRVGWNSEVTLLNTGLVNTCWTKIVMKFQHEKYY